jgi:hypothetical protein
VALSETGPLLGVLGDEPSSPPLGHSEEQSAQENNDPIPPNPNTLHVQTEGAKTVTPDSFLPLSSPTISPAESSSPPPDKTIEDRMRVVRQGLVCEIGLKPSTVAFNWVENIYWYLEHIVLCHMENCGYELSCLQRNLENFRKAGRVTEAAAKVACHFGLIHPDWVDSEEKIIASFQTWMGVQEFATCCFRLEVVWDFLQNANGNAKGTIDAFNSWATQIIKTEKAIEADVKLFWAIVNGWKATMPNQKRIGDSPMDTQPYKRMRISACGPEGSLSDPLVPTPAITPNTEQTTDSESTMSPVNLFQTDSPMVPTKKKYSKKYQESIC